MTNPDGTPLDEELRLAAHTAAVGGPAPFAILRQLDRVGSATTRQLTAITEPLGTARQTAVEKIVKRLERDGFVSLVPGAGTRHFELTVDGRALVAAVTLGASGPLSALVGRRFILVARRTTEHTTILDALESPGVEGVFDVDGDWNYVAVCTDEASLVRVLEDRLRALGADARSIRLASRAKHGREIAAPSSH